MIGTFDIYYGDDLRNLSVWRVTADGEGNAVKCFREEFGYNYKKIKRIEEVEIEIDLD